MFFLYTLLCLTESFELGEAQFNRTLSSNTMALFGQSADLNSVILLYLNINLITDAFNGFFELARLDLSHNELDSLDSHVFHDLVKLESLDLSHNNIGSLNRTLLTGLSRLSCIYLESHKIIRVNTYTLFGLMNLRQVCLFN